VAVTPDGAHVVTSSHHRTVRAQDIATGDGLANVYFLQLVNVALGPPVVAARHSPGDRTHALGCLLCRAWSQVPASTLGTGLYCPNCREPVRLNPCTMGADWRPVAAAWRGKMD
jgi:hypothetical protein